jgi:UDP:flavonoid glycosyltransferase YjiC (YdhE family)
MANILIVTHGLRSLLYPSVELGRRLAAAGHRLTFATRAEDRGLVALHGLGFLPLEPSRYEQFLDADAGAATFRRLLDLRRRREQARESMAVGGFARAVRDMKPDLILINGEMHEHVIAASGTGVPIALLNSFVSIWRQPGLPPPHALVRPGVGLKGSRLGISLLWLVLRMRKWHKAWTQKVERLGCDRVAILKDQAHDVGFDFRRETDDSQWLIPFTYRRLPVLSLHALEFEFPHRPPGHVHYVGPMVLESRNDRPLTATDLGELEAVFGRRGHARGERSLIYAGFGSVFSSDLAFLKRLLGVVAARPDWDLVISLSDQVAPSDLGPLPERVHAFSWVPQMDVLKHADVVVMHGGINTADECVVSGVPMLVYCGSETDMAGTTARVVHHGIGIAGDRRRDGTADIRAHIDRLLREPHFRDNVRRLKQSYAAYVEHRVAERTVDLLMSRPSPTSSDYKSVTGDTQP